jgi:hypothetical protein
MEEHTQDHMNTIVTELEPLIRCGISMLTHRITLLSFMLLGPL